MTYSEEGEEVKPKLLDLFCGAGGASMGYHRAGFEVVGVDNKPQPRYPFKFYQADALEFPLEGYDAYHASPPCQLWARGYNPYCQEYPDCLTPIRKRLEQTDKYWVIENVPKSPMRPDFILTGDMVGLGLIRRERWFETNWWNGLNWMIKHQKVYPAISVTGTGTPTGTYKAYGRSLKLKEFQQAMGIDWMSRGELSQAIPPAYTEYIGKYLMKAIEGGS